MRAGPDRTRAMEEVAPARRLAAKRTFDADEVGRWLRLGSDEERITALGMMQAKPELRDFDVTLAAIDIPAAPLSSVTPCCQLLR